MYSEVKGHLILCPHQAKVHTKLICKSLNICVQPSAYIIINIVRGCPLTIEDRQL